MAIGPDDVRFQGKTGSSRPTTKMTRLTQTGHFGALDRLSHRGDYASAGERGAAMDVGGWLRRLGLEQYEATFRENEIDDTVLPSLTAEDLKDLGVGIVGHRRKLLDAIAVLPADASIKAPIVGPELARSSAATPSGSPMAEAVGERRHITVMFCDLVGSTGISAGLDAEDCANCSARIWMPPPPL